MHEIEVHIYISYRVNPLVGCSSPFMQPPPPPKVKDGIAKIQAHKRRFAVSEGHRRDLSLGSTTFTDGESDSEDEESEFCGSGEWAEQGVRDFVVFVVSHFYSF